MPSFGWDCTNLPMLAGDREMGGRQVQNLYEKARELGAEYILITECGHANRSLVYEGPYMAGYKDGKPPVKIKHFVQLVYEYLRDGRIRIDPQKKLKAEQIKATGAKIVIAPCHNCYDQVHDLGEAYALGVKVMSFKEIIRETMIVPEHMRVKEHPAAG